MISRRPISLRELLAGSGIAVEDIHGNPDTMVTGVSTHAQGTARNEMFIAVAGTRFDSHAIAGEAVKAGASVLVVEREVGTFPGTTVVRVRDTRRAVGHLAHAFYRHPARRMNVCGVTGTNGKTTVTHLVHSILCTAGAKPGLIGTLGARFGDKSIDMNNTTPGPIELAEVFHLMDGDHIDHVVMECSSHAIDQGRIDGIPYRCGALTNMSQDHLDYHKTYEEYVRTKMSLFTRYVQPTPGSLACFNLDDEVGRRLVDTYGGDYVTFTSEGVVGATVAADPIVLSADGTTFDLRIEKFHGRVHSALVGPFNLSNIAAAAACAHSLGVDSDVIARGLAMAPSVPGRFEYFREGQPFSVLVDYAHTPDALHRVLKTARRSCANRLIVVFGCGGDRDKSKRPIMGKAVGDLCDFAIITSDNPRSEDPAIIARQVREGILQSTLKSNRYLVINDRRQAIERALHMAEPGDTVVIAGKGHETYQEIGTGRIPFDDRQIVRDILQSIAGNCRSSVNCETYAEPTT